MSVYNYSKYKILIDPESKKTQGLQIGDVVRRQYFDNPNLIYSLMIVLETGSDIVREKESPYFVGALVEGDEPQQGELLDFVRITNLFNSDRSGALYLTASDSESPYMDVIDGMATEHSLYLQEKVKKITSGETFAFAINGAVRNPERMVISYKIRASKALTGVPLTFGYVDGSEVDGTDTVDVSTEWQYRLSLITIDYPAQYARQLTIAPIISGDEWCEVSDLNIVRLSNIATFSDSTKARIGKITGIIDPVFGLLEGYGAYFQNLYATRNVNIAGTLTAGDENGFASTFYVGKIHKNVIVNSVGALFTGSVPVPELAPAGIGKVVRTDGDTELCVQSASWRMERIGKRYTFSLWIKGGEGRIALFQDEHYIQDVEIEIADEWRRYKVSFIVETSQRKAMYIRLETSLTNLLLTAPQLENGNNASQYQPTDEHLSYVEDYGAWFNKGGIGGTIQNPLLRLNEDGSISSRNGSFVINPDGTGHFSNGKFKWTQDDIELSDMTIRWGDLDEEAKDQILSQAKPSNIRAFVSSNLSTTQIYDKETRAYSPNWANNNLILTPSLYINIYGDGDLISEVADPFLKRPGIKSGSVMWLKNGKAIVSGTDSCWLGNAASKHSLTIKANHIGQYAPYMRYAFQAVWLDSHGNETSIFADIQFTQLTNPGARVEALAYAPDGNIFKSEESRNLTARCDLWRGANIDAVNAEYYWGVRDESVFADVQMTATVKTGSYSIPLRTTANMIPGGVIYIITTDPFIIQSVDHLTKTITLTTPLMSDYVNNSVITTPLYSPALGPGWAHLSEAHPLGVVSGWDTNEITISPDAVRNFETFKCAIKDLDTTVGNNYSGQVVFDTITFTDMSDPYSVDIIGTKGFVITNDENDIQAKALLYRSGKEIDLTGMAFHYNWKLFSADGDIVLQSYQGKQITVLRTDIDARAALLCEICLNSNLIARGQVSIVEINNGKAAYTFCQSIDKSAILCNHVGAVSSAQTIHSTVSVQCDDTPVTDFTIGVISKPLGFNDISVNQNTKTITYTISGGTTTLADTGTITVPIVINGQTFNTSFGWFKVKAGAPGSAGVDSNLLDWVADWNSGKTVIDAQSVITPKIFAGTKNANGTLTGMAIGKFVLSTQNAAGVIAKETVNGIYGFSNGKRSFEINATGDVQLGNGNEFIKYNATTGKVEFGSAVALAWVGSTYINASGIFTGTLSANTVNAIRINASQITAGTISADRIDVNALKASLITAGNIEALTLNVIKGKIGGWSLDADSIFRGTKNNTSGGFTAASGSITIGSNGIRGFKWKFDSTGSGAVAGGNIAWDAAGNVVFGASVVLNWTAPINSITSALGGSSYSKLTQISATGIYTGTITATQINAGTIDAARLNVDALKTALITAGNIEALSLNVTKGVIGGWTINAASISGGQIVLDKANNRIAVYGAASSSTGGHRVQLYHNSNTDFGLFATDTTGSTVVQLGSANRIAGWVITSTLIYKNSVYLGADGSITNGTKWKLNNDGSGQVASGNIAWDAIGKVTFASSVSLQWSTPIGNITNALGGLSFPKMTYISSTGIYTGTLTANQVNAVGISASSITTGTLSADRIAAGSINATKLDAVSIKASIINTDYINGLSCTFVRGTIGGFVIGSDNMTAGSLGATGQTPIQIRTTSSGSGYWYTCEYKPFGIAMTWHHSANAGHIVFGQIAASGNSVKTGFVGIQMMAWDNTEYFCLSTNYSRSGSKEVYNRIAGWGFDNANIWKNSVYLGSDGSIYNGNKWRLNNDGSGRVANGNIAWDVLGNVVFGSSVSLQWSTPINSITNALGGSTYPKTTYISSSGIYTGTLTASQITAGTISADRIAAGSITSAKLDAASIKANIINTSYINGLSCTFDRGTIGGWNINSYQIYKNSVALSSDGSITNGSRWRLNNDGSGQLANGNITWDTVGNVTARGAVFDNVRVQGSVRNPFVLNDSSIWVGESTTNQQNFNNYDNIVAIRGSWDEHIDLPWTLANSGRRVTLVNYKWGSNTTSGFMTIYAPSGKYFFEDGIQKTSITFSRETIELLGYGDNLTFFGWIVTNRRNIMCDSKYGSFMSVIASGIVTVSGTSASLKQKTFDGLRMSVSRTGVGRYNINLPWNLNGNYFVQMTGYYITTPIYATIMKIYSSYFQVQTQDDASANEGSFCFQIFSTADWEF